MANLHDNLKTNMAAIVNKGYLLMFCTLTWPFYHVSELYCHPTWPPCHVGANQELGSYPLKTVSCWSVALKNGTELN